MTELNWEDISKGHLMDGMYALSRHSCGKECYIATGRTAEVVCPKCEPEAFEKKQRIIELQKKPALVSSLV